jgi:hypothetical protein
MPKGSGIKRSTTTVNRYRVLWYLIPILLGVVGGVIAYLLVKDEDKKFAKRLLRIGIIITIITIIITVAKAIFSTIIF